MKSLINFAKRHIVIVVVLVAALALGANYYYDIYLKGSLKGTNTKLVQYPIDLDNKDGTNFFYVDSVGVVYVKGGIKAGSTKLAGVDSFLTTAAKDTVVISGVTTTSIFQITGKTFAHSPDVDTVFYTYQLKTDTLIVTRTKMAAASGPAKSAGAYSWIRIIK
jgi:hypothetical protein